MEDIQKNDSTCQNTPGFTGLWLAYDSEVASAALTAPGTRTVTFETGGAWGRVPATQIQLNAPYNDGAYALEISGILHATRSSGVESRLEAMCRRKFVAKLRDRNGDLWLAGMPDEPLNFEYEHVGDAAADGQRAYRLRLFRGTTYPVQVLNS